MPGKKKTPHTAQATHKEEVPATANEGASAGNEAAQSRSPSTHSASTSSPPVPHLNGTHASKEELEALKPSIARKFSERTSRAFLPDSVIAAHFVFRFLQWISAWFFKPWHGYEMRGMKEQPKDRAILFYGRHSTHNWDILAMIPSSYEATGRVTRALFHRLLITCWPLLKYFGGVPGHRESAVALLNEGFWCGVIPGGADEAMVGHDKCYQLYWPHNRKGFARVAMNADALLVPYFTRNAEESRFNIIHTIWHVLHGYVPVQYLLRANIPIVSSALYSISEIVWFLTCVVSIPVPVRCTVIFGSPVEYEAGEPVEDVVARCKTALQTLINDNQPNAAQGRNYSRALGERWAEWRVSHPKITSTVENVTPQSVKTYLRNNAAGGKKAQ